MQYCNIEDEKATIKWTWDNGKTFKQYISRIVPVKVETEPTQVDGINATGMWTMITYDDITLNYPFSYPGDSADSPVFNNRTITSAKDGRILSSDPNNSAGSVRARDIKFTPTAVGGYKIIISTISGSKLFEDKKAATSPPIYEVACGDNCPEGSHKCSHNQYPGYCCVPCKKVGDKLKNIAAKVGT